MVKKTVKEFFDIAIGFQQRGDTQSALKIYNQLEDNGIKDPNLYNLKALCFIERESFDDAEKYAIKAVSLSQGSRPYFLNTLGMSLKHLAKYDEAVKVFKKVLELEPNNAEYVNNAANVFYELGTFDKAAALYKMALKIDGTLSRAYENLSTIYLKFKMFKNADDLLQDAINTGVYSDSILHNRIAALIKEEQFALVTKLLETYKSKYGNNARYKQSKIKFLIQEENRSGLRDYIKDFKVKKLDPGVLCVLSYAYQWLNQIPNARKTLNTLRQSYWPVLSEHQKSVCNWNTACIELKSGNLEEGWEYYRHRFEWRDFPTERRTFSVPRLTVVDQDCSELRLMICREQGLGDELLFSSLINELVPRFKEIIIETTPKLASLFAESFKQSKVRPYAIDPHDGGMQTEFDYDCYCWMGDLPELTGFNRWENPREPYLKANDTLVESWRSKLMSLAGSRKIIGLTWRSIKMDSGRAVHYTELADWVPLIKDPSYFVVSLQYDDITPDLAHISEDVKERLYIPEVNLLDDIDSVAAMIECTDLVISPYNSTLMQAALQGRKTLSYLLTGDTLALGYDTFKKGTDYCYPWFQGNITKSFKETTDKKMLVENLIKQVPEVLQYE